MPPTATSSALPTLAATDTPAVPPPSSSFGVIAPAALKNVVGKISGSRSSLGLLQQKGTEDDPAAYVTFQTPKKAYVGYQTFYLPGDVSVSSVSSMTLELNYKAAAPINQTWTVSIYNWKTKKWVKLGSTTNMLKATQWVSKAFTVANFQRYISSGKEIRIQLRSNNPKGDLKVDYEVIKITSPSLPTVIYTPTTVYTPTDTPTPTPIP